MSEIQWFFIFFPRQISFWRFLNFCKNHIFWFHEFTKKLKSKKHQDYIFFRKKQEKSSNFAHFHIFFNFFSLVENVYFILKNHKIKKCDFWKNEKNVKNLFFFQKKVYKSSNFAHFHIFFIFFFKNHWILFF